ncbi:MAG: SRPBCC domain-containing protein [Acidobacteriota bacterium]
MTDRATYTPGPAAAQVEKGGEKWTLILVRDLRHAPGLVWEALIDPAHLREWAPFDADGPLDTSGATVHLTWTGTGQTVATTVTRVDRPRALEYGDLRWQLEPLGHGTRLTLWATIDRRFVAWGAAGWHIALDGLDRLLAGDPIGRIAGAGAMQFEGWQRLVGEYAEQFGVQRPKGSPPAAQKNSGGPQ